MDAITSRFGVRKIETRGRQILLNGEPIRLQGVNRYDEYARYGPNAPRALVIQDLRTMKSAGVNLVRVHYPQSPELLSLYDEMGFLMMEEVPLSWWGNGFSGQGDEVQREDILNHAIPFLEGMIRRDKNHPSVVIWSMCNESKTDNDVGITVMRKLIRRAKELDRSRLVTFVINNRETEGHRAFEEADLVAFNVYVGGYRNRPAQHVAEVRELIGQAAEEHIRRQLAYWPDKPLMVAEFGTPGVPGVHGDVTYTEEYQAALIDEVGGAIARCKELSGGVLWSWADYYHRRNYIKYAAFGPYGVVTVDRKPKVAFKTLLRMYGGKPAAPANR
ncbi:MAG: glycoside hydrolase family 2 TIM barrel-domain containing protein [Bryobacteraceae bacterium]